MVTPEPCTASLHQPQNMGHTDANTTRSRPIISRHQRALALDQEHTNCISGMREVASEARSTRGINAIPSKRRMRGANADRAGLGFTDDLACKIFRRFPALNTAGKHMCIIQGGIATLFTTAPRSALVYLYYVFFTVSKIVKAADDL
ncbi:hypothetical protein NDU88_008162 [Pleurodeles waltl]|uniref:Uncharacterized protein n=1 Tax=Pleurodeles waltl TaxID=8319 RepID=A0AAV7N5K0_PLEWA|nr:hypothetical protein NDU88_008162 [Pleurodeles waltl]